MSRVVDGTPDRREGLRFSTEMSDDAFQQSMARLSLHLATRHSTVLLPAPRPLPAARRWAGWPYLVFLVVAGAGAAGYLYSTSQGDPARVATSTMTETTPVAAASVKILAPAAFAAQPAPAVPSPAPVVEEPPVVKASLSVPPPKAAEPAQPPLESATDPELTWAEVLDLQKRLASLGVNPGPLDGINGPRTTAAVQRYQELKGLAATAKVDRRMLKLLQQDGGSSAPLEARAP